MLIYWVFGVNVMCPISISIITYASFQLSNIKVLAGQDHHLTEMNNFFFSFQYANHVLPFSARVVTSPSPEILDVSVLMWTGTSTHPNSQTKASCHLLQSLRCTDIAQSSAFPSPGLPESDSLTHRLSSGLGTGMWAERSWRLITSAPAACSLCEVLYLVWVCTLSVWGLMSQACSMFLFRFLTVQREKYEIPGCREHYEEQKLSLFYSIISHCTLILAPGCWTTWNICWWLNIITLQFSLS